MVKIKVCSPKDCSSEMLDEFRKLVCSGGEVQQDGLADRVKRAAYLAFAQEQDDLQGVAALKKPNANYRARVFEKAGSAFADNYPYELGWVYVVCNARGRRISRLLVQALCKRSDAGIYATSRNLNTNMHRTLKRVDFKASGNPYDSAEHPNEKITLFLRSA